MMVLLTPDAIPLSMLGNRAHYRVGVGVAEQADSDPDEDEAHGYLEINGRSRKSREQEDSPAAITRPMVLSPRTLHLSESDPLTGPMNIRVASRGIKNPCVEWVVSSYELEECHYERQTRKCQTAQEIGDVAGGEESDPE
jgi:hypothetical protein